MESRDFGSVFATEAYVSATVATALTGGNINLDGYATEQFVEQKLVERPLLVVITMILQIHSNYF